MTNSAARQPISISLVLPGFRLAELLTHRMRAEEDAPSQHGADQVPTEDPYPGELPETEVRQQQRQHHEREFADEEPERHPDHETWLPRGAVDGGHHRDAISDVEQAMDRR